MPSLMADGEADRVPAPNTDALPKNNSLPNAVRVAAPDTLPTPNTN